MSLPTASPRWSDLSYAERGGLRIAYQSTGPASGVPLLLVAGLGAQLLSWHDGFCEVLATRGFAVARFDNRDVGLSTHLADPRSPGRTRTIFAPSRSARYDLEEMAGDAIVVLDALGWERAVVLGVSLGGAVAQTIAICRPERVAGLVSVMSTPSLRVGRGRPRALLTLVRAPARTADAAQQAMVDLYRVIGSPGFPLDERWLREIAAEGFVRGDDPAGVRRQLAALLVGADRRPALSRLDVPTLVVHGVDDPVFAPSAARATAAAVPGARLVLHPGMGHDLPRALWPAIVDDVARLAGI